MRHTLCFFTALLMVVAPAAWATTYQIDSSHSFPQFEIRHMNFSMIHGRFDHMTGTVTMDKSKNLGSVQVKIAVDSMDTGFGPRNEHLLKADFFDAKKYPVMTYRSTKVVYSDQDKATVYGKLTMKGVTKPVKLHVSRIYCAPDPFSENAQRCSFDAKAEIKRSDFGVSAYVPAIPDTVRIVINVEAVSVPSKQEK